MADGPASFNRDFSCPSLLRIMSQTRSHASPTGLSPSLASLSNELDSRKSQIRRACRLLQTPPTTPHEQRLQPFTHTVWALPPSLAATKGITVVSFSSGYLDVSVPPVRSSRPIESAQGDGALPPPGFPIRISRDQRSRATPPGFSQLATSFFADLCPGIHHYALTRLIPSLSLDSENKKRILHFHYAWLPQGQDQDQPDLAPATTPQTHLGYYSLTPPCQTASRP